MASTPTVGRRRCLRNATGEVQSQWLARGRSEVYTTYGSSDEALYRLYHHMDISGGQHV
jgi:hypothetical protein